MDGYISYERLPEETELQYIWRLCSAKDNGVIDLTWEALAEILNVNLMDDESEYLGESAYRKKYQMAKAFYDDVFSKMVSNEYHDRIAAEKRALQKERYKLQAEKSEYNRWLREDARDELFQEKVIEAIAKYGSFAKPPEAICLEGGKREGLLCIADCHFGKEFQIYDLNDEIANEYSPEIFYERMDRVYSEALAYVRKEGITSLHIHNLGDHIEGFIRNSQIWSLRYGAIDSAVLFGNYMGDWLRKLSADVAITYAQTDGNHDELRLLDGKKGQHLNESVGKIVKNCIVLKNERNPNFVYNENKTGHIFDSICGYSILGIHGEIKDAEVAIHEYGNIYRTDISYLVCGHRHQAEYRNAGPRRGCITVGSIIGDDSFARDIRHSADATASIFVFEEGKGKVDEHTIVLN